MIDISNVNVYGWEAAIRGMRNPMNSWDRSDSYEAYGDDEKPIFVIGENDLALMKKLIKGGTEHRKFLRMINVTVDINAPLYWWKEFDTYKVGTVANSCSSMHRLTQNPFTMADFSFEHLAGQKIKNYHDVEYLDEEKWAVIENHPSYEISSWGRVFNKKRNRFLVPCVNSSDYKKYMIQGKNYYAHRLVAKAFIPTREGANEINHIDGNKWNNHYTNLEWCTKSENSQHAFDNGLRNIDGYTRYKVSKNMRGFSPEEINHIFELYESGVSQAEICKMYGCYSSTISNLINGKTYKDIEFTPYDIARITVDYLNDLRDKYLETKNKDDWWQMIQLLPSSYNQKRTVQLNYEVLMNQYKQRENHKLTEWHDYIEWIETLPYMSSFLTKEND